MRQSSMWNRNQVILNDPDLVANVLVLQGANGLWHLRYKPFDPPVTACGGQLHQMRLAERPVRGGRWCQSCKFTVLARSYFGESQPIDSHRITNAKALDDKAMRHFNRGGRVLAAKDRYLGVI